MYGKQATEAPLSMNVTWLFFLRLSVALIRFNTSVEKCIPSFLAFVDSKRRSAIFFFLCQETYCSSSSSFPMRASVFSLSTVTSSLNHASKCGLASLAVSSYCFLRLFLAAFLRFSFASVDELLALKTLFLPVIAIAAPLHLVNCFLNSFNGFVSPCKRVSTHHLQ